MEVISREYVESELARYKTPGMGVGVIQDGKVVFAKGFGYQDMSTVAPITENTQWGIASCTKSFTATLCGMLADEGYFTLEQPIREYLPDFQMYDPVATKLCTLKDMLCHRTGLGGYDAVWADNCTREDLWRRLRYLRPNASFRGLVQYNNLIYTMAGHVCEKVTGLSWDQLVQERIFAPLGMNDSNTSIVDLMKSSDFAQPYWPTDEGPVPVDNWNVDLGAPAAAINSTINDMLKWLQFNLDDGVVNGKRLIKKETLEEIHTAQVRYKLWPWDFPENPPMAGYALGWYNDVYRGIPVYWHIGEIEGYGTMMAVLPRQKTGIVLFNNLHAPDVLIQCSVMDTIIDNLLGLTPGNWAERYYAQRNNYGYMLGDWRCDLMGVDQVKGTSLSHDLKSYVGEYYEPGHGTIKIFQKDDGLGMIYRGVEQPMKHYHYDVFKVSCIKMDTLVVTAPLSFRTNSRDGSIDGFEFKLYPQVEPILFKRSK